MATATEAEEVEEGTTAGRSEEAVGIFKRILAFLAIEEVVRALRKFIEQIWEKWRDESTAHVAKHVKEWTMAKLFGIHIAERQRFNDALHMLDPNEYDVMILRFGAFTTDQMDYFITTVMQETAELIAEILRKLGQAPDDVWDAYVKTMNSDHANANKRFHEFMAWVLPGIRDLYKQLDAYLNTFADERGQHADALRDARVARESRNVVWKFFSSFARALALPGEGKRSMKPARAQADTINVFPSEDDPRESQKDCGGSNPRRSKIGFSFCWKGFNIKFDAGQFEAALFHQRAKKDEPATTTPRTDGTSR